MSSSSPLTYDPISLAAAFTELYSFPLEDGTLPWVDLSKVEGRAHRASRKLTDKIVVAATQIQIPSFEEEVPATDYLKGYVHRCVAAVEMAVHANGADVVLLSELFCAPYFCQSQHEACLSLAVELSDSSLVKTFQALSKKLSVVLPLSFYELAGQARFNSVVVIDSDGSLVAPVGGTDCPGGYAYRKSHIPDGTGYQEKFYFSPGDSGFKVYAPPSLLGARLGIAICWDQWFPEPARAMALMGADILFYPTAIGSEPQNASLDSSAHWRRAMQGHSAANLVPLVTSNRAGVEVLTDSCKKEKQRILFYGTSFITDNTGGIVQECCDARKVEYGDDGGAKDIEIISFAVDVHEYRATRASWGVFRDRRPELYKRLLTLDGRL